MSRRRRTPHFRRNVRYVIIIVLSVCLIYLLVARQMRFFVVPTRSMEPTLIPPEYLVTLQSEPYRRGDIVVIDDPTMPGEYLVKRLIGIGGDEVAVRGGGLFLNGSYASEPYLREEIDYTLDTYRVGEEEIFVLGDNRNESVDSHNWSVEESAAPEVSGVPKESIVGRVYAVYLPFDRIRKVISYPLASAKRIRDGD